MIDRKTFFDRVRASLFNGAITPGQVSGCEAILTEWDRRGLKDLHWLAYMLATAYHETDRTMQAIREYGRGKGKKYGVIGRNGQVPYGRGLIQLTWDENYERADKELELGGALIKDYDLALRLDIAVKIMFDGMIKGWFTGKRLAQYFTDAAADWTNARRIINGLDRAELIKGYAQQFHTSLVVATGKIPPPPDIVKPVTPAPKPNTRSGAAAGTVVVGGGAVIANEVSKKGASGWDIAMFMVPILVIAVAAFFLIRNWGK